MQIEVQGVDDLNAKLTDPQMIAGPLKELLEEATSIGVKTAVEGVDGGSGAAVRSISKEVLETSARVYSAMPRVRALNIEKGRPVGVPVEQILPQIISWKKHVGHPEPAIVIAQEISQRGVKGRFFMAAAKQKLEEVLPRLLGEMASKVQVRFGR